MGENKSESMRKLLTHTKDQTQLCLLNVFLIKKKRQKSIERLIQHVSVRNNGLIMWLVSLAGSCLVPVQHYSRKPAAGPSCDQRWTDSNDHPATGQGLCAGFTLLTFCRLANTGVRMLHACDKFIQRQRHIGGAAGRDTKQFLK